MDDGVAVKQGYVGGNARSPSPPNKFQLTGIDHVGIPCRDPQKSGKFVEQILGGIEVYRAGFSDADRARGRDPHIFYHVGPQLIEVVQPEDHESYPDKTNPLAVNTNPHWAFGATPENIAKFCEHLTREGIPFNGPRSHRGTSVVSVYFRDLDGNNLEVTTWEEFGPEVMDTTMMGGEYGFIPWKDLAHNWEPHD